jgi:hypothetical protein
LQRHLRLQEDLRRDVFLIVHDDAARIDQLETASVMLGRPMDTVACDPRLIADNSAPLSRNPIEEGGLSNVGPAHDHHCG